jgi:hypothetical protein
MRGLMMVALGASLLQAGCKRTVQGENAAWTHNVQHVAELSAQYPGFANALKAEQKRGEELMSQARSMSDQVASANKMGEANAVLVTGWIAQLDQLALRTRALREKSIAAATEAEHGGDQVAAKTATDDAQRVLRSMDDTLKTPVADAAAAASVLLKLEGEISVAASNLDRVLASARERKAAAARAAAAPPAGAPGAPGAPVAKVQWKCSYCNAMNDDAKQKCHNCGAPRMAAKTPPPAKKK